MAICTAVKIPPLKNNCEVALIQSSYKKIAIGDAGRNPFVSLTDATEWAGVLDDADILDTQKIRMIDNIDASLDAPAYTALTDTAGKERKIGGKRTINISWGDISQENFDFIQKAENEIPVKAWLFDEGGHIDSWGVAGIDAILHMDYVNPARGASQIFTGTLTWKKRDAGLERIVSPI